MSKEEMKLILEALEGADWYINQLEMIVYSADDAGTQENRLKVQQAITVMRLEVDAKNMASTAAKPDFWEGYVPEPDKRQQALDKKAENARELGLDYEPAQQEPVAWIEHEWSGSGLRNLHFDRREPTVRDEVMNPVWTPLYTSPPAQRTWVGLTDAEIGKCIDEVNATSQYGHHHFGWHLQFARAIEAKLKEKNT